MMNVQEIVVTEMAKLANFANIDTNQNLKFYGFDEIGVIVLLAKIEIVLNMELLNESLLEINTSSTIKQIIEEVKKLNGSTTTN